MTRTALLRAVTAALAELDVAARVASALTTRPSAMRAPFSLLAVGKAAPAMARGALERHADAIARCLVVCPDGTDASALSARVAIVRAGHPLPDARSVRAGERCLAFARSSDMGLVVLVSGGASALACAPASGVDLATKRAVTAAMLRSGASVQDTNIVRKHLSRIKGGGLARAAFPAPVMTLVASDVVGGSASDVGSGPAVADPSTVADARALLRRFAPSFARLPLARTLGPSDRAARGLVSRVVASPDELARLVAEELRRRGFSARALRSSDASVAELARSYVALAHRLPRGGAVVRAAEPALVLPASAGKGGRSTHLAALVGRDLPRGALFLALATDGVDGPSGTAGALVHAGFAPRAAVDHALARFATAALHRRAGTALPSSPSGVNFADLHVLVAA